MYSKSGSKCLLILMSSVILISCSSNRMAVKNQSESDVNNPSFTEKYSLNPIVGSLVEVGVEKIVESIDPKYSKLLGLTDSSNTESYENEGEDKSSSESEDAGSFESEDAGSFESEDAGSFESEDAGSFEPEDDDFSETEGGGSSEPESEYNYKATRPGFCFVTNHWERARAGHGDTCAEPQPIVSETRPVTRPIVRDHRKSTRTYPRARVIDHRRNTRTAPRARVVDHRRKTRTPPPRAIVRDHRKSTY